MVLCLLQVGFAFMANDWRVMADNSALAWGAAYVAIATFLLGLNLADRACSQGYGRAWGLFALLSFVGLAIVYYLPDQTNETPGFPIEPSNTNRAR
jgi:hypothetical protein